ncbi:MAG: NAD-dependent epimerase/dehydratase family protein, partial [Thermoleophilia bacterium]|nr:NAD-dependent epimerase/dehydratase family protein [Thermoleophilia bacterium]
MKDEAPLVLVTGAAGFIGRHVMEALSRREGVRVVGVDCDSPADALPQALDEADIIFHLAGVNRPETVEGFQTGNVGFTEELCEGLQKRGRRPLVVFSSSIQAALDNPYGKSKRLAEDTLRTWATQAGAAVV